MDLGPLQGNSLGHGFTNHTQCSPERFIESVRFECAVGLYTLMLGEESANTITLYHTRCCCYDWGA